MMETLGHMVSVLTYRGIRNESHSSDFQEGLETRGQPYGQRAIEPHKRLHTKAWVEKDSFLA